MKVRPLAPLAITAALLSVCPLSAARAQSLDGSRTSLVLQNLGAAEEGFTYLRTDSEVQEFVKLGLLVRLPGNGDYELAGVSYPYARREVKLFVERLAHQYRDQCGEPLVVTSLTRPVTRQPRNASELSVHPTGMAIDLRRSDRASCRTWLEATLLRLEGKGVLEATREHWPAHYHVSVFGTAYGRYVAQQGDQPEVRLADLGVAADQPVRAVRASYRGSRASHAVRARSSRSRRSTTIARAMTSSRRSSRSRAVLAVHRHYRVGRGDNLWEIARRHKTSVAVLKKHNRIRSNRLKPGQLLSIPAR
jgi:hypothetical protein